jgi:restriction system protein
VPDPLPKYDDFMVPTLKALAALGGSATVAEVDDRVAADMRLSQSQLDRAHEKSGGLIVATRMGWARSWMKSAGLVESGGFGVWVLTDLGREAADWSPARVKKATQDAYKSKFAKDQPAPVTLATDQPPDEPADEAGDWSDALLAVLRAMDPSGFERLCQRLLRESGFVKVEVTGKSGDGGIDGVGVLRMNLISFQVLFQCKRYAGSVGAGTVRDFRGAMQGRADKGLVITTGSFTAEARREATRDGAPAIDLIDGEALCDLLRERRLGVRVEQVVTERVVIDADFLKGI